MKSKTVMIKDIDSSKEVLINEAFRVDHPFRATRQMFGPNVLDLEGDEHLKRKKEWLSTFSRKNISSVATQELIHKCIQEGIRYAMTNKDLFLAATYIPNRVILTLLGCPQIDPMVHYKKIRPLIQYLEDNTKPEGYQEAKSYIRATLFTENNEIFQNLPSKERESDVSLLAVAGAETTIVAMKQLLLIWADNSDLFTQMNQQLGPKNFVMSVLNDDPPLGIATRFCAQDVTINGTHITKGDIVHVSILEASQQGKCPLNPEGQNNSDLPSFTFGYGKHHCPGHLLAKEELYGLITYLTTIDPSQFNITKSPEPSRSMNFRHPKTYVIAPNAS